MPHGTCIFLQQLVRHRFSTHELSYSINQCFARAFNRVGQCPANVCVVFFFSSLYFSRLKWEMSFDALQLHLKQAVNTIGAFTVSLLHACDISGSEWRSLQNLNTCWTLQAAFLPHREDMCSSNSFPLIFSGSWEAVKLRPSLLFSMPCVKEPLQFYPLFQFLGKTEVQ